MTPNAKVSGFLILGAGKNLHDVMNDVSRHIGARKIAVAPAKTLSEFEAFSHLDPLLSDLNKQYCDARATHAQAMKEFGRDDAMTEMAALMEDSAWCAVQTRYMEIRRDRAMMATAQKLMEETRLEEIRASKMKREKESLEEYERLKFFSEFLKRQQKNDTDTIWALWYLMTIAQSQRSYIAPATLRFNAMAA